MRHILFSLVLFGLFSLCVPHNSFAVEVSAEGINKRQALNAALQQAVEMSLGTQVESNTLVENFQVVRQQILSHTKGFVRRYDILEEETTAQGSIKITIEAEVDEQGLQDSSTALSTLMKMAAHPQVLVAAIDEDFDAVPSLNNEFRLLSNSVEDILRRDFRFKVLDSETTRLRDKTTYRFSDRKNNLKRAQRSGADYLIFVELLKGRKAPYTLRLETVEVATGRALRNEETDFNMADWTADIRHAPHAAIAQAKDYIYGPSAQIAAAMIDNLRREVYEDGQRYQLYFDRFQPDFIEYLETDLGTLSGYVRHKITRQKKNALALSYWSALKPGALNKEISALLDSRDIPFRFEVRDRQLSYRYDDPMFE